MLTFRGFSECELTLFIMQRKFLLQSPSICDPMFFTTNVSLQHTHNTHNINDIHTKVYCTAYLHVFAHLQDWDVTGSRYFPEERALSEDVLHLHPWVWQECGSAGRAGQEEPSVRCCGAGIWGNGARSTCLIYRNGCVFWVNAGSLFIACVGLFLKVVFYLSKASPRCANLALRHYLLKPIQRIPQYQLLFTGRVSLTAIKEAIISLPACPSESSVLCHYNDMLPDWASLWLLIACRAHTAPWCSEKDSLGISPSLLQSAFKKIFEVQPRSDLVT